MTGILIADEDSVSEHTGSTAEGAVKGSCIEHFNDFVFIEGKKILTEEMTMEIPSHCYDLGPPPLYHSHSFQCDTMVCSYFYISGKRVILIGDKYSEDETSVITSGSNTFFNVII